MAHLSLLIHGPLILRVILPVYLWIMHGSYACQHGVHRSHARRAWGTQRMNVVSPRSESVSATSCLPVPVPCSGGVLVAGLSGTSPARRREAIRRLIDMVVRCEGSGTCSPALICSRFSQYSTLRPRLKLHRVGSERRTLQYSHPYEASGS